MKDQVYEETKAAITELVELAKLKQGDLLVVGCSSSEVKGETIGTNSSLDFAKAITSALLDVLNPLGIHLAAQCCEHLNRSLVVSRSSLVDKDHIINAIPTPDAGGSFATTVYERLDDPILVDLVKADAGLDIGSTLIGMHLRRVAVPVRLKTNQIGKASLVAARTRPAYSGGPRAKYDEALF